MSDADDIGDADLKGREDRVRRLLQRQGLALRKSRYRAGRLGYGGYMILDTATGFWSHGALPNPYSLSIEDAERIAGAADEGQPMTRTKPTLVSPGDEQEGYAVALRLPSEAYADGGLFDEMLAWCISPVTNLRAQPVYSIAPSSGDMIHTTKIVFGHISDATLFKLRWYEGS